MGRATDHVRSVIDPDDAKLDRDPTRASDEGPDTGRDATDAAGQSETGTEDAAPDTASPSPDQPQEINVLPVEQADDASATERETR